MYSVYSYELKRTKDVIRSKFVSQESLTPNRSREEENPKSRLQNLKNSSQENHSTGPEELHEINITDAWKRVLDKTVENSTENKTKVPVKFDNRDNLLIMLNMGRRSSDRVSGKGEESGLKVTMKPERNHQKTTEYYVQSPFSVTGNDGHVFYDVSDDDDFGDVIVDDAVDVGDDSDDDVILAEEEDLKAIETVNYKSESHENTSKTTLDRDFIPTYAVVGSSLEDQLDLNPEQNAISSASETAFGLSSSLKGNGSQDVQKGKTSFQIF